MEDGRETKSKNFQDVETWKKAHQLVLAIYKLTECFPKHEMFGLTSQLRRAAVSVPANIAEGFKRQGKGGQNWVLQHCPSFVGRMSLLSDSLERFELRRND